MAKFKRIELVTFSQEEIEEGLAKVIVEELPPANDRKQWRLIHRAEGTVVAYIGETVQWPHVPCCWRCEATVDCFHCAMLNASLEVSTNAN